jgi:hypothetical protein
MDATMQRPSPAQAFAYALAGAGGRWRGERLPYQRRKAGTNVRDLRRTWRASGVTSRKIHQRAELITVAGKAKRDEVALIVCAAIGLGNEMMVVHVFSALTGTPRKK